MRILLSLFVIKTIHVAAKNSCAELKPGAGVKVSCGGGKRTEVCGQPMTPGQTTCKPESLRISYEAGTVCTLTCENGYLPKPLLKNKDDQPMTKAVKKCPDEDGVDWTSCVDKKCDDTFECVSTAVGFGTQKCAAPASGEIRTTVVVTFPTQQGPYFVTDKASGKRVVFNDGLNPFPSGSFVMHEYTKIGAYAKTCIEYHITGLSSASNTCVQPGGLLTPSLCSHNTDDYKDPKLIQDTKTDCTIPISPDGVAGCEYTEYMARHGFKSCSSGAKDLQNEGCKFHVHTYTVNTQNGIARDSSCLGYVGGHYDPLKTSTYCNTLKSTDSWKGCEQGDLSGKYNKLAKDTGKTALQATVANDKYNLNVFTKVNGEEGAFSRALVFHHPDNNGQEAWFCSALGTSCDAAPADLSKPISDTNPISFDTDCSIEKTSLLYVWGQINNQTSNKYIMFAGEKDRKVPGRQTRLPTILNHAKDLLVVSGPTPKPFLDPVPKGSDATLTTTNSLVQLVLVVTVFVMGY